MCGTRKKKQSASVFITSDTTMKGKQVARNISFAEIFLSDILATKCFR